MVDISNIVNGIINQLITWGAPPCRVYGRYINRYLDGPDPGRRLMAIE